jgi:hypothetical protein
MTVRTNWNWGLSENCYYFRILIILFETNSHEYFGGWKRYSEMFFVKREIDFLDLFSAHWPMTLSMLATLKEIHHLHNKKPLRIKGFAAERVGFEPTVPKEYTRFPVVPVRPLRHLSNKVFKCGSIQVFENSSHLNTLTFEHSSTC